MAAPYHNAMIAVFLLGLALGAASPSEEQTVQLLRGDCPMFWYSFSGRCYRYISTDMTWADAELHCLTYGANLVSIHSKEEHDFVNSLIMNFDPARGMTWIGLSDLHKEGNWMWSDGLRVHYANWAPLEPNNQEPGEHCAHTSWITDYKWNDEICSEIFPFVCASRKHS